VNFGFIHPGQQLGKARRVIVILCEAFDMMIKSIKAGSCQNTSLAGSTAEHFAPAPGSRDKFAVASQDTTYRSPKAL
jgi:hypothetical protein